MRLRDRIRLGIYRGRRSIDRIFNVSLYRYGQFLFRLSVLIFVLLAITVVWRPFGVDAVFEEISNPAIFDQSLSLIVNFMSIIFVLVIFLIQNANQEYSPRLSMLIFKNRYLLSILAFILGFSAFNLTGLYLGWAAPFDLISYVLSIVAILLIGVMILFTGYFLNISNIVDYVTDRILGKIEPHNIYSVWRPLVPEHDEEFTADLTKDIHLLSSTGRKAIEKDQRDVFESTLNSVSRVADRYLEQTSGEITNDEFVSEIVDYFEFLKRTALEDDSRQKYLDDIAEVMGDMALSIVQHRDMGGQSQMAGRMLDSIKGIFYKSYGLELTAVGHVCINKIDEVSVAALEEGDYNSYNYYNSHLDDIADLCVEAKQYYSAVLLQRALNKYQWQYVRMIQLLLDEKLFVEDWAMRDFFSDFVDRFTKATSETSMAQRQVVYAGLYGVKSFNWKLQQANIRDIENPRVERLVKERVEDYIDFQYQILTSNIGNNHLFVYGAYPELLYLVSHEFEFNDEYQLELVEQINDNWLDFVEQHFRRCIREDEGTDMNLEESMMDYYAILLFFHQDNKELLQKFTEDMVEIYRTLPKNQNDRWSEAVNRSFYKQLKLYGCWLSLSYDIKNKFPDLFEVLVSDFEEVVHRGKALPTSATEEFGYPSKHGSGLFGAWFMSPSEVWGNKSQYAISAKMNQQYEDNYQLYHEMAEGIEVTERPRERPYQWFHHFLKTYHDIRLARSQGQALKAVLDEK